MFKRFKKEGKEKKAPSKKEIKQGGGGDEWLRPQQGSLHPEGGEYYPPPPQVTDRSNKDKNVVDKGKSKVQYTRDLASGSAGPFPPELSRTTQSAEASASEMGSEALRAQMQLEQKKAERKRFAYKESPERRARKGLMSGDRAYEATYAKWVESKLEGMNKEIDELTEQLGRMQPGTTSEVSQPEPVSYNPQAFAAGEGYSYGAVSGGGLNRMDTISRSQQVGGFYGSPDVVTRGEDSYEGNPAGGYGDQTGGHYGGDPTQRASYMEALAQQEQERLAQQGMQQLAERDPGFVMWQGLQAENVRAARQRQPGQRRRGQEQPEYEE